MRSWRGLLLMVGLIGSAGAGAWGAESAFDPETMLDVSQIQRGEEAIGKSVFQGTRITEFRLQIIDILRQANLGQDMILARVLDGPVVERQCGIIGGMSGSPVYIRGKLVGAIAWGWTFQKEPICGITPIRAMLEALTLLETPAEKRSSRLVPEAREDKDVWRARRPFTVGGRRYWAAAITTSDRCPAGVLPLRPVATPLLCSGFGPETMRLIEEMLGPLGLEAVPGGGTRPEAGAVELEPGAAVGVRFMEGDFDMTGIGTVTWRQGERVLAFGHPLMQLGQVQMPLTTVWIHEFIPSYMRTSKLGSPIANVGALQADGAWAIGGRLGTSAPQIPARVEIIDQTRGLRKTFSFKALDQPGLTPSVLLTGIADAMEAAYNPGKDNTIRLRFRVKGKQGAIFTHENQFAVSGSPTRAGLAEIGDMMEILENNRWEPQGVAEIEYQAEISNRNEGAAIERAWTEENVARAGKEVHLHVLLRPDGGTPEERVFTLSMPWDLPKGALRIGIGPGDDAWYFRSRLGIMLPRFESLPEVAEFVARLEQNRQLCVVAALPQQGLRVGNARLARVPAAIAAVFEKAMRTDVERGREELFAAQETTYVIYGREMLALPTEDRLGGRGTVSPKERPSSEQPRGEKSGSAAEEEAAIRPTPGRPLGPWWAASALQAAAVERLRAKAAAAGRPWPMAMGLEDNSASETKETREAKANHAETKAEPTKTTPETPAKGTAETPKEGVTIVRQPKIWLQREAADFQKGEAKGIALCSEGGLALAPRMTPFTGWKEGALFQALAHGDNLYVVTGAPGRLYRLTKEGEPRLLAELNVFALRGLAVDAQGNIYCGAWPGGKIFRVSAEGQITELCALPCDYIWALAWEPQTGRLLAGTGPKGELFAIEPATGKAEALVRLPQAHILSLLVHNGRVVMGTASKGVVYELTSERSLRALFSTGESNDVTSLAVDPQGTIYAGVAGSPGAVYAWPADASRSMAGESQALRLVELKDMSVYALAYAAGGLYAGTGPEGKLLLVPGEGRYEIFADTEATHLLCLTPWGEGLFVGAGNSAQAWLVEPNAAAEGVFTSSVLDAGRPARWGAADWEALTPPGSEIVLQTRSGESPDPEDGSWSGWTLPYQRRGQDSIGSPPGRYLQYRVQMKGSLAGARPRLRWISLGYLPANQRPSIGFDDSLSVEKPWRGEIEIKWRASDPDKDALVVTLEFRPAGATAWQPLKSWGPEAKDKSFKWKTNEQKDGRYELRLTASDENANPGAGLTEETILYGVLVDNTPPAYTIQKQTADEGQLMIEGLATDPGRIVEIAYQLGNGSWRGAVPLDGLFDGTLELFRFSVPLDKDGKANVRLRCMDAAGNVTTGEIVWPPPVKTTPRRAKERETKQP